jgi:hypothetical protein
MKIHEIKIYQEFDTPVELAWEAFSDHVNFGKINGLVVKRIVDSPDRNNLNGVGSVRLIKVPLFAFEETVTKSKKPNLIEYQISRGTPLNHHYGTMVFESLPGNRSSINYTITLGSKIPLVGLIVKNGLQKGLKDGLKKYAEKLKIPLPLPVKS